MNLITGATGLIGSHLAAKLLLKGEVPVVLKRPESNVGVIEEVISFYTPEYKTLFNKLKFAEGDITDIFSVADALEGVDTVYHCAGLVSFEEKKIKDLLRVNAEGTANVVNACLDSNAKNLCHVSSVATMPNFDKRTHIDETVFWKSSPENGAYAISKYNAEREVWRGSEEGLNVVIVNPSVVLGAGSWGKSSGRVVEECYKGTKFYTSGVTGFVDVRDVAACMIGLMEHKTYGKRFIVSGNNVSFHEIFDRFHKAFGNKPPTIEAGKWMLKAGSVIEKLFMDEPRITKTTIDAGLNKNYFSASKIKKELNYEFIPIKETINYVAEKYMAYRTAL